MPRSILDSALRHLLAVARVSVYGSKQRIVPGLVELIPQVLFLGANCLIVFTLFKEIRGVPISTSVLVQFCLTLCAVDCLGDSLLFKGLWEYAAALRRRQCAHYQLSPGPLLCKVFFLRWDLPLLFLGLAFFAASTIHAYNVFESSLILVIVTLFAGIATHILLTGAFFVIQAYFDPSLPLQMGSPATRLYTKPLHLLVSTGTLLACSAFFYPAYFITAFPSHVASTEASQISSLSEFCVPVALWVVSLVLWYAILTKIVKASCENAS